MAESRSGARVVGGKSTGSAGLRVAALMTPDPVTVGPHETLADAIAAMRSGGFRRLPVVAGSKLVGIVTERDLRVALSAPAILHERRDTSWRVGPVPIGQIMTRTLITVSSDTTAAEAARLILHHKIGGMPVVDDEQLVGVITTSDFLWYIVDNVP